MITNPKSRFANATRQLAALLLLTCTAFCAVQPTAGQVVKNELPEVAKGIGVDQRLGQKLPLDVNFEDDKNNVVNFRQLFKAGRPIVLSFNYSDCPKLCVVQLQNLAAVLQSIDLVPGKDFEIVSVSLDPTEQSSQLAATKKKYVTAYGDMKSADGWHFLRGSKANIRAMTEACGFKYKYVPSQRFYAHQAAFIFCTTDGKISSYADGLAGNLNETLKPSLIQAGKGQIGSFADRVKYFSGCFVFDPSTGKHSVSAIKAMRLAGATTIVALAIGIGPYMFRRRQRSANNPDDVSGKSNDKQQDNKDLFKTESPISGIKS